MTGTNPPFVDHALSARLEAAEAAQLAALVEAVSARLPERRAAAAWIGGGCAAFVAPHVSLSRAAGLGMAGPVEPGAVEALEAFYRERDTEARILVSPFADETLFEQLGDRGFRLVSLDTVLVRRMTPGERFPWPGGGAAARQAAREEAAAWVDVSLRGFAGSDDPPARERAELFEAVFHGSQMEYFFGSAGGETAGAAAVLVHEGVAHLFAASTLARHRGRGVQGALVAARLELAAARGCHLAFAATAAGSGSQRNLERWEFRPAYSQAVMIKRFDRVG